MTSNSFLLLVRNERTKPPNNSNNLQTMVLIRSVCISNILPTKFQILMVRGLRRYKLYEYRNAGTFNMPTSYTNGGCGK